MHRLSRSFLGVMAKRLSAVEANRAASNQHEFNGTALMKRHLGLPRRELEASFIYVGKQENDRITAQDRVTWYDSRERAPDRSEHRLYFRDNAVMRCACEGDVLVAALRRDGSLVLLIVDGSSELLAEVLWLFGVPAGELQDRLDVDPERVDQPSEALFNHVAEAVGLDLGQDAQEDWLDLLLERFGVAFPTTREISALALETLSRDLSPIEEPDHTLIALVDREEAMFRQLERYLVGLHLAEHADEWKNDVDAFVSFSLGVHNRRKSRAGHALENHLEWILAENRINFERGSVTEGRSRPDFLFPGKRQYDDCAFRPDRLSMLGVKTTCKDRWRQVLNEAARIREKHLLTLQPGISEYQTDEMKEASLSLVVPEPLHINYGPDQIDWLLTVGGFIEMVRGKERDRHSR